MPPREQPEQRLARMVRSSGTPHLLASEGTVVTDSAHRRAVLTAFRIALELLTCLPPVARARATPDRLVGSLLWFPVVGALLGAALGLVELGARAVTHNHPLACALVVALGLPATRGRPLRGLMSTGGALFGGRDPEGVAQLAAHPQPTRFGLLMGMAALLLKYALLMALDGETRLAALVLACGMSRAALVWVCWRFPYANLDTGIGAWLTTLAGARDLVLVLPVMGAGFLLAGPLAVPAAIVGAWLPAHLLGVWVTRTISGLSAQACEAAAEIGELGALAAIAALAWSGLA